MTGPATFMSELEYCHPVRGQIVCKGIWPSVAFGLGRLIYERPFFPSSAILGVITVKYKLILLSLRYADPVVLPYDRREIADEQKILLAVS